MDSPDPRTAEHDAADSGTLDPALVRRLRASLLSYYASRARDLPWRRTDDPYRIWVSEVMLQQTRVETAVPYYRRWLGRFPDVETLARAELDEVLKAWEGLGYYRRARMLHRAAGAVMDRGGMLPTTAAELRRLPGIGEYTAGAVASIAFGRREPAVDGNARRVLSRVLDLARPSPAELRRLAAALVPANRPGEFNQALMELGATICTARRPVCEGCPVATDCLARAAGSQEERPGRRQRRAVPTAEIGVAVPVRRDDGAWCVALVRRPLDTMLGGLWEFPGGRIGEGEDASAVARRAAAEAGVRVGRVRTTLPTVDHLYSHLRASYHPYLFEAATDHGDTVKRTRGGSPRWMDRKELDEAALPGAQRAIVASLLEVMA
jgi:A/G-specific adenine glycosylase